MDNMCRGNTFIIYPKQIGFCFSGSTTELITLKNSDTDTYTHTDTDRYRF